MLRSLDPALLQMHGADHDLDAALVFYHQNNLDSAESALRLAQKILEKPSDSHAINALRVVAICYDAMIRYHRRSPGDLPTKFLDPPEAALKHFDEISPAGGQNRDSWWYLAHLAYREAETLITAPTALQTTPAN